MSEDHVVAAKPQQEELYTDPIFKEMVEAGLFFGRKRSRTNPRMKPYILTNRNDIEIVNLTKTQESLDKAMAFLSGKVQVGANVLFVGTQPPAGGVKTLATEFGIPFVDLRWLGGTLTNFKIISARIEHYKKLKADWAKNAFEKHTKKERLDIQREIEDLSESIGGLEPMIRLPDVVVVVDAVLHLTAVREAIRLNIPVVAFVNTDTDPNLITYPVVGNTKARLSINWFLDKVREAILGGRTAAVAMAQAAASVKTGEAETDKK